MGGGAVSPCRSGAIAMNEQTQRTNLAIEAIFSRVLARPRLPLADIRRRYAIVSTPRCGSTMFCDVLTRTAAAGTPGEWINTRYMEIYAAMHGLANINVQEYLADVMAASASDSGVFGIHFHVLQYVDLRKQDIDL